MPKSTRSGCSKKRSRGGARLATELGDPRRDVHVEVRVRREHAPHPRQVLGEAPDVRADEGRGRMRGDHGLEGFDQAFEPREARIGERPLGMDEQLLEPFVALVDRFEEGNGIRDVDHDRQSQLGGGIPRDREPFVIREERFAMLVAEPETEVLPDLDPHRARGGRRAKLRHEPVGPARFAERRPVQVAERRESARMRPVVTVEVRFELVAPPAVQVHDRVHAARRHVGEQGIHVRGGPAPVRGEPSTEMVVRIHRGEPSARHEMVEQPDGRARSVRAQRKVAQRRVQGCGLQSGRSHEIRRW